MKRPVAFIMVPWSADDIVAPENAARYYRKVYNAIFNSVCPLLFPPLFLNDDIAARGRLRITATALEGIFAVREQSRENRRRGG